MPEDNSQNSTVDVNDISTDNQNNDSQLNDSQESSKNENSDENDESDVDSELSESSIGTICPSTGKWMWQKGADYIGKTYLASKNSLRTIDWSKNVKLLQAFDHDNQIEDLVRIKHDENVRSMLYTCSNLLTKKECDEIINNCCNERLQKMNMQYQSGRNNSRLVLFDRSLSDYIWKKLKPVLESSFSDCQLIPFGFDVLRGEWELSGINEAFRLNQYDTKNEEYFSVHRDAQYCPSGDERSIFSVVIYLNDGFVGGDTMFYFPKDTSENNIKGLCIEEEISKNKGLDCGYEKICIKPKCGECTIFSPNILHESIKVKNSGLPLSKYIIKTDIMMKRANSVRLGFNISSSEKEDYFNCLQLFRKAQKSELQGAIEEAGKCYEKCLSIRYLYPTKEMLLEYSNDSQIFEINNCDDSQESTNMSFSAPSSQESNVFESSQESLSSSFKCSNVIYKVAIEVWIQIMSNLDYVDILNLAQIFPHLKPCLRLVNEAYIIPKVVFQDGIFTKFSYKSYDFVTHHFEACCRVLALYSVYLLGHSPENKSYTVRYDPETNQVTSVPLKHLLFAVFYEEPSYGSIFKVKKNNESSTLNETKDLFDSVDRNFMMLRYDREYFGIDMSEEFCCNIDVDYDTELDYYEDDFAVTKYKVDKRNKVHINGSNFETLCSYDRAYHLYKSYDDYTPFCVFLESFESYFEKAMEDIEFGSDPLKPRMYDYMTYPNSIGAVLVRKLTKKIESHGEAYGCKCQIGDSVPSSLFSDACETKTFNHLVYDFDKQKLQVEKRAGDENSEDRCCSMEEYLDDRIQLSECKDVFARLNVHVEQIVKDASFNHASCQCSYPSFELNEYVNLQSYPLLNHVHVLFTKNDKWMVGDEVDAWTSYGGIVCL